MRRRRFIKESSLLTLATGLLPMLHKDLLMSKSGNIGVQLYSVRDNMASDPVGTLLKIGEMGYPYVETAGYREGKFYGLTPGIFTNLLNTAGLKSCGGHFDVNLQSVDAQGELTDKLKKSVDAAARIGQQQFICPWIDAAQRDSESIDRLCDVFNKTGAYCRDQGLTFAFHNHDFEFTGEGETLIMDQLIEGTDPALVFFQLDLYWIVYAGSDPIEWIRKMPGRVCSFHVKDMAATLDKETVEVGKGVIDFSSVFEFTELAGVKYYIVELEHYRTSPMQGIKESLSGLKEILKGE